MNFKILKMQPSIKPLSETKLCVNGIITLETPEYAISFEIIIEQYKESEPSRIIDINQSHYASIIDKYGVALLLEGVKVDFVSDILDDKENVKYILQKEAEKISYSIIAQFERDTLFNQYNPGKLREYIENKIMDLNEKFKIESK
jgi:hypothetical protein